MIKMQDFVTSQNIEEMLAQLDSTITDIHIATKTQPQQEPLKALNSQVSEFINLQESALTLISETLKPNSQITVKTPTKTKEVLVRRAKEEIPVKKAQEPPKEPLKDFLVKLNDFYDSSPKVRDLIKTPRDKKLRPSMIEKTVEVVAPIPRDRETTTLKPLPLKPRLPYKTRLLSKILPSQWLSEMNKVDFQLLESIVLLNNEDRASDPLKPDSKSKDEDYTSRAKRRRKMKKKP